MSMYRRRLMIANALKKSSGINYPGLIAAWSAKGKTNDDEDRAILKDLTGNGHDITLNGFAFSEMSGYGGYQYNWLTDLSVTSGDNILNITHNKIKLTKSTEGWEYVTSLKIASYKNKSFKLNVHYETKTASCFLQNAEIRISLEEGINVIPMFDTSISINFSIYNGTVIEIELIPEYPDALVFDGVDDYGINENMPILDDFTLIIKNKWFDLTKSESFLISKSSPAGQDGAFILGRNNNSKREIYYSYYEPNKFNYQTSDLLYITPKSYNGNNAVRGTNNDSNVLNLGTIRKNDISRKFVGAFYSAYLFDRSLDEQEIKSFIRKYIDPEYLLPSEIPTPDCYYDFSLGSNDDENRETIKDQSGNGNNAKAYNIAWNQEGSGYKDEALYLDGTDDYIALDAFDKGFNTIFMLCNFFEFSQILYDQRLDGVNFKFAIYNGEQGSLAYKQRNDGETYINGVLNTTIKTDKLINKKHLITIKNNSINPSQKPIIGSNQNNTQFFANMAIYKFLGFKKELTEEQIQAIIKKYNLLDGVDEI